MKYLIALVLIVASLSSSADSLYTGAWSSHLGEMTVVEDGRKMDISNETHYLLAYEHNGYIYGAFKNSFGEPTIAVGKRFELFEAGYFKAGIYVGASYGYFSCTRNIDTEQTRNICPALIPEISYTAHKLQPTIMLLGDALALSLKWDI